MGSAVNNSSAIKTVMDESVTQPVITRDTGSDSLMNIRELAVYLNMKQSTIYALVERRQIPHIRIGKLVRFNLQQVNTWLASLTVLPDEAVRRKDNYRGFRRSSREIDNIVNQAIAESQGTGYTAKRGKQPASSGKEV